MPLRGKIWNTWEVESDEILASQEVHDIAVALGVDPVSSNPGLRTVRYVFWPMPSVMDCILRRFYVRCLEAL